ncbi:PREDICTED: DELLA protein GAIP-like isoform X3 [Populus euphratica]|uniref:DELLA protein GAIP-like isoform X3 n=1 Tax=Populus euphratica TaxID=75702 RepID=A0AAJ6UUV7_POPEU|nr:PREDICTED: DELLA protein GAIP-like isoform X3 [Populus euphratica]
MDSPLVIKLMDCAKAIADGDLKFADQLFSDMESLSAAETNRVTKKVVEYFAEALARRVHGVHPRNPFPLLPSSNLKKISYEPSPLEWFACMSTDYAIRDVLDVKKNKLHLIEISSLVDCWQRHSLEEYLIHAHHGMPLSFQYTSIRPKLSKNDDYLQENRRMITEVAQRSRVDFKYRALFADSVPDIVESVLRLERTSEDEIIIVRWVFQLHKLLALEGAVDKVLSKLKDLKPDIMVIVEQEADNNTDDFFYRFATSFKYYLNLFESLELYATNLSSLIWERHLRWQICNVVASEGIDRIERHETLARWQQRLYGARFCSVALCSDQFADFLYDFSAYKIEENSGFPVLLAAGHPLIFASVWKPASATHFSGENIGNSDDTMRGTDLNHPITIQEESTSPVVEPEAVSSSEFAEPEVVSSSESDDDNEYVYNRIRRLTHGKIWSVEEVREYLVSPLKEKESKRLSRWKSRQLTRNVAGRDKQLNVTDTSLASLLRIPPSSTPIREEKQYYVDDSVINAFFDLLKKRQEKFPDWYKRNSSLPTWTMTFLLSGKWTMTKLLSCINIEDIAGTAKLFIPLCLENHWILICVDMEKREFLWLDSLNSPPDAHHTEKTTISEWLVKHLLPVLGYRNSQQLKLKQLSIPYQTNRIDCGIFVMKYADCLAHCDHFPFTQQDMPHFRLRVFLDIYRGRLPVPPSHVRFLRALYKI